MNEAIYYIIGYEIHCDPQYVVIISNVSSHPDFD